MSHKHVVHDDEANDSTTDWLNLVETKEFCEQCVGITANMLQTLSRVSFMDRLYKSIITNDTY